MAVMPKDITSVGRLSTAPKAAPTPLAQAHESMEATLTTLARGRSHPSADEKRSRLTPKVSSVTSAAKPRARLRRSLPKYGAKAAE